MTLKKQNGNIIIKLSFWEKIFSFHGNFVIQKKNVRSIKPGRPKQTVFELKIPGSYFPGLIKAGTFISQRGREFWCVSRNSKKIYTIELKNSYHKRLVIGLDKLTKI